MTLPTDNLLCANVWDSYYYLPLDRLFNTLLENITDYSEGNRTNPSSRVPPLMDIINSHGMSGVRSYVVILIKGL